MIIQLTNTTFIDAYRGCGGYLVALDGDRLADVEHCLAPGHRRRYVVGRRYRGALTKATRDEIAKAHGAAIEEFDTQVAAFRARNPARRITYALGSCTELIISPTDDCAPMPGASDCEAFWRVQRS